MVEIVGVSFRKQAKVYYFSPKGKTIQRGQGVIVETTQGKEYGICSIPNKMVKEETLKGELKPICRIATKDDESQVELNKKNEEEAFKICKEKIREHDLQMKLISAEYAFNRAKLTFRFTAAGRIDFRDLVKDLAAIFRTRIELRQVGVRDEARILGGLGACGRPFCCSTWLPDFVPVSIKVAKEQNIALNSAKISGMCGKLMCCLKNEYETYKYLNEQLPNVGNTVKTFDGFTGVVQSVDVLRQQVNVVVNEDADEKEIRTYTPEQLKFQRCAKCEKKIDKKKEEELKKLEDE